jgi:hypothetical protein
MLTELKGSRDVVPVAWHSDANRERTMAQRAKKTPPKRTRTSAPHSGAGAAISERTKDTKKTFGKAAPRQVKPAAAQTRARTAKRRAADNPSAAMTAIHGIGNVAKGLAASVKSLFRRKDGQPKAKQ